MMILPEIFQTRLKDKIGDTSFEAYVDSFEDKPIVSVRHNQHKGHIPAQHPSVPWCDLGYYLDERPIFTLDPAFHGGAYYVQEASSMFLWHILENLNLHKKDLKILDLSAAPGGKSTLIANWLNHQGLLCANDPIKHRAYTLKYNILKEGYSNVIVTHNDPRDYGQIQDFFDIILIDAPCSGEGMFRKDPDTIKEWSEENIELCAARQKRIVADVLPALKTGGLLIYSTCTFNESENIDNVLWMQKTYDLKSISIPIDPAWGIAIEEKKEAIGYQFYPHRVEGEGFFVSVAQKQLASPFEQKLKQSKHLLSLPDKNHIALVEPWIAPVDSDFLIFNKQEVHCIPEHAAIDIYILNLYLKIIHFGITIGNINKNIIIPDHSLALALCINPNVQQVALDKQNALLYLKKELQHIDSHANGWVLVTYHGLGIGWLKNIGHRFNNYLPSEYRILMALPQ